jgi:hypothetical protein
MFALLACGVRALIVSLVFGVVVCRLVASETLIVRESGM